MSRVLYPEFPPIAILSALVLFIPLPWHWRTRNVATLSIILWLFTANLIYGVDAILWKDNVVKRAQVWCDITTKLIVGINFALPAACLCICMHLEHVASSRPGPLFIADKRRRQIFEAFMCFALPILFMTLHYVVQGHRFDIIQGHGCRPSTYFSVPALFIVWIPPLVIATVAIVYSVLALRHFLLRRLTFATVLSASKSRITTSRYLRLMSMAVLQMIWLVSVTSYNLWFTFSAGRLRPWTTWDDVHFDFGRIDTYPLAFVPSSISRPFYASWMFVPLSSWLFVVFFAFGRDAVEEYKKCFIWIQTRTSKVFSRKKNTPSEDGFVTLASPRSTTIKGLPISSSRNISTLSYDYTTFSKTETTQPDEDMCYPTLTRTLSACPPYMQGPRAVGSVSDLSPLTPYTPSTAQEPLLHNVASPLSPGTSTQTPSSSSRSNALLCVPASPRSQASSRPLTYPSYEAAHYGINPPNPDAF